MISGLEGKESIQKIIKGTRFEYITIKDKKNKLKISNRLENNYHLSNKKALFYNLKSYFDFI